MIITKEMFESFGGWCPIAIEGDRIAPLPQEYDIEYQLLIDAGKPDIAEQLAWRKPQLIIASGHYELGNYRVYDPIDRLYLTAQTFEGIEDKISEMREEFYQTNKKMISAVIVEENPDKTEKWIPINFEDLLPNKKYRIYNFENGENVPFENKESAELFIAGQIQKIKESMPMPMIQQKVTHNQDGLTGWLMVPNESNS